MQFDGKGDMRYACAFFVPLETIGVSGVCVFTHALFSHFLVDEHRECTFDATMVGLFFFFSETKLLTATTKQKLHVYFYTTIIGKFSSIGSR